MAGRREATREAKAAVANALELDDADFEAHRALAGILTYSDWDFPAAEKAWTSFSGSTQTIRRRCKATASSS